MMDNEKWRFAPASKVLDFIGGGTPAKSNESFFKGDIPWITVRDMKSEYIETTEFLISEEAVKKSAANIVKAGSVVIATRVGLGKVCMTTKDSATNQDLKTVLPKKGNRITDRFIYWFFRSVSDEILNAGTGATVQGVKLSFFDDLKFPILSEDSQISITNILDASFSTIDHAKANLEKNLQNAKDLFQSELNRIFSEKGEDWEEKKLKDVTTKIGSGATPRGGRESYKEEGISLIRSMNVHDIAFVNKNLALIDEKQAKELNNVTLEENDVLLNITGASVARSCVVPADFLPARVNQHVSIIRTKKDILYPVFLNLLLVAKPYKDQLLSTGEKGATRQAITKIQIENFEIRYPKDLNSQKEIVQALENIKILSQQLQSHYTQKLQNLEELKKSILQKAFTGQLTNKEVTA